MSCVNVQYIDGDECIGASLPKINGNFAALSSAVCELSANVPDASINVFDSPTIDLDWNSSTRTLSSSINNGFIFVPLNDPTDPLNNNSNALGTGVINFIATGNTTTTPYTGATQTANLASLVPNNAYMALIRLQLSCNLYKNDDSAIAYIRKNALDSWRALISDAEGLGSPVFEANAIIVQPIIFDKATKTFEAYLYSPKSGGAPTQAPSYIMQCSVLGYYIK